MDTVRHYFPELSALQHEMLDKLTPLYTDWNSKINVISRKDMDHFRDRHVLHSLAIYKIIQFPEGSRILDIGTGGGFPGVPLAIANPTCSFVLLDSVGKKLKVIDGVAESLGIQNITTVHERVEEHQGSYNYLISRAVTNLPNFMKLTKHLNAKTNQEFTSIYYLKGGDFNNELKSIRMKSKIYELNAVFNEAYFETKKVVKLSY
jgi:16S rRNA (guanine527-N7)-methyltransferase